MFLYVSYALYYIMREKIHVNKGCIKLFIVILY